jgi:hypothetical protein
MAKSKDLTVLITTGDAICDECGKELDAQAIRLAVVAHIRHRETAYDQLLVKGHDRHAARQEVRADGERVLSEWEAEE